MSALGKLCVAAVLEAVLVSACGTPPGQPRSGSEILAPREVLEFGTLYSQNCAGCHGESGRGGAAMALADPVYLAIADEERMRKVAVNGVPFVCGEIHGRARAGGSCI